MGRTVKVELKGLTQTTANLRNLKQSVRTAILKPSINEALKPCEKQYRANVSVSSGLLKKSIGRKVSGNKKSGAVVGKCGARRGFKQAVTRADGSTVIEDAAKIAHIEEGGRKAVEVKSKKALSSGRPGKVYGKRVAAVPARHSLQRAWNATAGRAESVLAERVAREIAKQTAKGKMR